MTHKKNTSSFTINEQIDTSEIKQLIEKEMPVPRIKRNALHNHSLIASHEDNSQVVYRPWKKRCDNSRETSGSKSEIRYLL